MGTPVYRVFTSRPKEAWYALPKKKQEALIAKLGKALEQVGGKGVLYCSSDWSSEQWESFGVEEFPDVEAVRKLEAAHHELQWHRYVDSVTVLGTKWEA